MILFHYTQCNHTAKCKYGMQGKLQIIIMIDLGVAETAVAGNHMNIRIIYSAQEAYRYEDWPIHIIIMHTQ